MRATMQSVNPVREALVNDKFTLQFGGQWNVPTKVEVGAYKAKGMAVRLVVAEECQVMGSCWEPGEEIATISVWVPATPLLPAGCFFVKDWSENQEIVPQMVKAGVLTILPEISKFDTGFVSAPGGCLTFRCPFCAAPKAPGDKCVCQGQDTIEAMWVKWINTLPRL